jgi:hypothetical protein
MQWKLAKTINELPKSIFPKINKKSIKYKEILVYNGMFHICFIADNEIVDGRIKNYSLLESSTLNSVEFPILYCTLNVPKNRELIKENHLNKEKLNQ